MAKFRRSPKFGRNHSRLGSLDGVQFTHPLAEITQRTRWGPEKVQVTLKPFIGSRTNHNKSSLPTLGSFRYPQRVQNGPFGLKQTLTGRKNLYSEKGILHGTRVPLELKTFFNGWIKNKRNHPNPDPVKDDILWKGQDSPVCPFYANNSQIHPILLTFDFCFCMFGLQNHFTFQWKQINAGWSRTRT